VNLATGTPGVLIPVPGDAQAIAITPDGKTAYVSVTSSFGDVVLPIDLATNSPRPVIPLAGNPGAIAITSDGKTAYVAVDDINQANGVGPPSIIPINIATGKPEAPTPLGGNLPGRDRGDTLRTLGAITIAPDDATAYILATEAVDIGVIPVVLSTRTPEAFIPIDGNPSMLAMGRDGRIAYVTTGGETAPNTAGVVYGLGGVVPIDLTTRTVGARIKTVGDCDTIAISSDGKVAFVSTHTIVNNGNGFISVVMPIDLQSRTVGNQVQIQGLVKEIVVGP
jgi:hypothetical protein